MTDIKTLFTKVEITAVTGLAATPVVSDGEGGKVREFRVLGADDVPVFILVLKAEEEEPLKIEAPVQQF